MLFPVDDVPLITVAIWVINNGIWFSCRGAFVILGKETCDGDGIDRWWRVYYTYSVFCLLSSWLHLLEWSTPSLNAASLQRYVQLYHSRSMYKSCHINASLIKRGLWNASMESLFSFCFKPTHVSVKRRPAASECALCFIQTHWDAISPNSSHKCVCMRFESNTNASSCVLWTCWNVSQICMRSNAFCSFSEAS